MEIEEIEKHAYKIFCEIQEEKGEKPLSFEGWKKLNELVN